MVALALVLAAMLPSQGVLVPHRSLAGVRLGETPAAVRAHVGRADSLCKACDEPTWFYFSRSGDRTGLGVTFRHDRVAAVFTLGSPPGWRSTDGLRIGRLTLPFPRRYPKVVACYGFVAHSVRRPTAVTSVFTIDQYVSGFALTVPSESVCR